MLQSVRQQRMMRFASGFAGMLISAITAPMLIAETQDSPPQRNIVLVVTDDESPTLGCYGDPVAVTPHVDALAADGTRFNRAFATVASCSPSRAVILTGLQSHQTGQYGLQHRYHKFSSYLNVASLSLPRVLAAAGYRTARCGKFHVAPEAAFHFETQIRANCREPVRMADRCREFLADHGDGRPFFLYLATCDPHRSDEVDATSPLELKPNLFGNLSQQQARTGVKEVFYDPDQVPVPDFLPDTPETRAELAQYYQACSRIDAGLGRLIELLKELNLYDRTMIVFTSDHGMAFAGAKTTLYEAGLRVPMIVRNPYVTTRPVVSHALVSHVDITPSLLDFAGALDARGEAPQSWESPEKIWADKPGIVIQQSGGGSFRKYQGRSWLPLLGNSEMEHHDHLFASHTFHEVTMYYPMRAIRDQHYKLIWNIAHELDFPFASDLWAASSWQAQLGRGRDAGYGFRSIEGYLRRPEFELYDIEADPHERTNLATRDDYQTILAAYQQKLRQAQAISDDPWLLKWDRE